MVIVPITNSLFFLYSLPVSAQAVHSGLAQFDGGDLGIVSPDSPCLNIPLALGLFPWQAHPFVLC